MAVFRVQKTRDFTVMSNHHLRNTALSLKAKGIQSLMLSLPENWDFTTKGLSHICKDGVDSISAALNELERHGYLSRRRLRDEHGRLGDTEYTIHEQPINPENLDTPPKRENPAQGSQSPKRENPVQVKPILDKPVQEEPVLAKPVQEKPAQLNTKITNDLLKSNTHGLNIHQSIQSVPEDSLPCSNKKPDWMDRIDAIETYREMIMENVEYKFLIGRYGLERMDELVELMLETVLCKRDNIRIAGDDFPREVVKSRILKINSSHVEYVFDCIDKNTTKVRNIKAYLLTALYNAPATMDSYYRAEVNHDFYGTD